MSHTPVRVFPSNFISNRVSIPCRKTQNSTIHRCMFLLLKLTTLENGLSKSSMKFSAPTGIKTL